MLKRAFFASPLATVCLATLGLATGCSSAGPSSSSPSADGGPEAAPAADAISATVCTGRLLVDKPLMRAMAPQGWSDDGSLIAPAGTAFLLAVDSEQWQGYVIQPDTSPTRISADFGRGLVKGTDFSSDCAADDALKQPGVAKYTVLQATTLHPNADLTGPACTIPAGVVLTNYSFQRAGNVAQISANEVRMLCNLDTAYSGEFEAAALLPR